MQISKEEREELFNEYKAHLKERAERRKAAEEDDGSADKHKVWLCVVTLWQTLIIILYSPIVHTCHAERDWCEAFQPKNLREGHGKEFLAKKQTGHPDTVLSPQKKRHKEKKDKRDRDGDDDERRHKRSKR